ncbi:hypothetical protein [Methylobacterium sp. J-090]|uniref:hypothetical protein n=1 Tax=Methylobacterium sp. J-090 TaxID=2836666 RepID=UPI001FBA6A9C|nr:hypothetical protein [Methylobacterium sp. J-090]MCJ2080625.1 hypothetical protein [Methylobacterium sp. J-090]
MTMPSEQRVAGQLFAESGGLFVARYPLSTALPIPLALSEGNLLTWAFCGLGRAEAVALIVFAADAAPESLTVTTHFHDLTVTFPPPRPGADLDPAERAALCPAVLGALTPTTFAPLSGLLALLGPALSTLTEMGEGPVALPELALTGAATATLTGSRVPNFVMLRSGALWRCLRVVRAHLSFGAAPRAVLDLDPVWGEPSEGRADAALLVEAGEIFAARVPA